MRGGFFFKMGYLMNHSGHPKRRLRSTLLWSVGVLSLLLILPLLPYGLDAVAASSNNAATVENPGTDLWRAVRQRDTALDSRTQVQGVDSGQFINVSGDQWRHYRMEQLIPIGAWVLGGMFIAVVLFRLVRGQIPIAAGRSGESILRFTLSQRTIHWFVAITFVLLALTGLVLLYGRFVLIPILGADGFGATASLSKTIHDYVGPAFGVGLLAMIVTFMKGNFPSLKTDLLWILKGGGIIGKGHPSAGRYNAGEKIWFWIVVAGGLTVVFSGLVLDFPAVAAVVGESREDKSFYHLIHSLAAVVLLAAAFGHIYMGTVAMEGAAETMRTGYADTNWAKEHHDLWYEEMMDEAAAGSEKADGRAPDAGLEEGRQA